MREQQTHDNEQPVGSNGAVGIYDIAWSDNYCVVQSVANQLPTSMQAYDRSGTNGETLSYASISVAIGSGGSLGPSSALPTGPGQVRFNHDGTMLYASGFNDTVNAAKRYLRVNGSTFTAVDWARFETASDGNSTTGSVYSGSSDGHWGDLWPTYLSTPYVDDIDY